MAFAALPNPVAIAVSQPFSIRNKEASDPINASSPLANNSSEASTSSAAACAKASAFAVHAALSREISCIFISRSATIFSCSASSLAAASCCASRFASPVFSPAIFASNDKNSCFANSARSVASAIFSFNLSDSASRASKRDLAAMICEFKLAIPSLKSVALC